MRPVSIIVPGATLTLAILAGWAWGGVEGSKHDFSNKDWAGGDACAVCHAPQRDEPPAAAPLWDADADLNRRFAAPLEQSKRAGLGTTMCLRCHDGTIAKDTIGGVKGDRFVNKENPGILGTGHGTSEHPVGVRYPDYDEDFHPAPMVIAKGPVALPGGKVECVSCHDPHDMAGERFMLVLSNARSRLCLTCHRK